MAEPNYNNLLALAEKMPKTKPTPKSTAVGTGMASGRTDKGMRQGSGFKTPEFDYMGYAFDAAVRKGKDAARMALKTKISNLDAGKQKVLLAQFDDSIGRQQSLQSDRGLGEGYKEVYREAGAVGAQPTREEADKLVNARKGMSAITNVFNRPKSKPKPVGTDRYYGEGGI